MTDKELHAILLLKSRVESVVEKYDRQCPQLECDGFTRIASYLLTKAKIKHVVKFGEVLIDRLMIEQNAQRVHRASVIRPHFWIEVPPQSTPAGPSLIVDYRLRMWAGRLVPHGVFTEHEHVTYSGETCEQSCNEVVFSILTLPPPQADPDATPVHIPSSI